MIYFIGWWLVGILTALVTAFWDLSNKDLTYRLSAIFIVLSLLGPIFFGMILAVLVGEGIDKYGSKILIRKRGKK